jgi:hypothetical protein
MITFVFFLFFSWTETFETQDFFPPDNWLIVNQDALDAGWFRDTVESHSSIHAATCYNDTAYAGLTFTNLDYLITPRVIPSSATGDTLLSFWFLVQTSAGCTLDIMVSLSDIPSMTSFVVIHTSNIVSTSWTEHTINLSAYNNTPVYLALRLRGLPAGQQFFLDDVALPDTCASVPVCCGRLRSKGPPYQKYLQVWGSHYDMGYAHGFLLGEEVMANFTRVFCGLDSFHFYSPIKWQDSILPYYNYHFSIPQKYQDEAQGMYDGMSDRGVDLNHPDLGRDITIEDILCMNADPDFIVSGCSSISGWGESTIGDDTLQGGMLICRTHDGGTGQYTSFGNTTVLIACAPSAPDEQDFVMISKAGDIGCASAINRASVGLCRHTGNHPDTGFIPPGSLIPLSLSQRHTIEAVDPDSSGVADIYDIVNSIDYATCLNTKDTHIFSRYDGIHPIPAGVLEMNNLGDSLRLASDNDLSPHPIYSDWNCAVTNHDRVLYAPESCWRYQRIADSLNNDFHLSTQRAIRIIAATCRAITFQFMVLRLNLIDDHPDWDFLGLSHAYRYKPAQSHAKIWYSWKELFDGVPGIAEHAQPTRPGHQLGATIISGPLHLPDNQNWQVFDITGRQVSPKNLQTGIYFLYLKTPTQTITRKVVKVK